MHNFCKKVTMCVTKEVMKQRIAALLERCRLRNTMPRRQVLSVLVSARKPVAHKEIHDRIAKCSAGVNLVTVYRILEKFEACGIVHRHPSSGRVTLCSLPDIKGHHGFLSCRQCGTVEEFSDSSLCAEENRIAKKAGFRPLHHVSDIVGLCGKCG